MVSRSGQVRKSGNTAGQEEAAEAVEKALEDPKEVYESLDDKRSKFRTPGFSRMRFTWKGDDNAVLLTAHKAIDDRILERFGDAFRVMHDLFLIVREPQTGDDGEILRDDKGWPIWKKTPSGAWVEDFTKLTRDQKENVLFQITTRLFAWEQAAAESWTEAMFAKSAWEEAYGISYDEPMKGTIEDRTAYAQRNVIEERYFAVFVTAMSRKADAIVRTMALIAQRLKDTLEA